MAIELINVKKEYMLGKTKVEALRGVSVKINEGEFVSFAGPSGSGKTTILNLIGALDKPTSGRVLFDDRDIETLSDKELARLRRDKMGFIFQSFNLIPVITAYENVEYPLILKKFPKWERRQCVEKALKDVKMDDRMDHLPDELSGGQRQRVAIARALVSHPEIILADEPTANLDSHTGNDIIELMQKLNEEQSVTFIFSTHDTKIMKLAHRVIHVLDGEVQNLSVTL